MPKIILDPVKQAEQFKNDLAAMRGGKEATAPQQRLLHKNFGTIGQHNNEWQARLPEDQTIEHALQPQFWASVAEQVMGPNKLDPRGMMDLVHVRKLDTMQYVKFMIVGIGKGFIKLQPIEACEPPEVVIPEGALTSRWNPGKKCHEVLRNSDKQLMATGFQSKADAAAWIADHMSKMAA